MAVLAQRDQENRSVEVNRKALIETLRANREKHIVDYEEAKAGYKAVLLSKVDAAFEEAKKDLAKRHTTTKQRISEMTEADITRQRDSFTLIDSVSVDMKVPRSFAEEYDAAIAMAEWDTRDTLVLTYAEFTCFVRDKWDWKSGFDAITTIYKSMK